MIKLKCLYGNMIIDNGIKFDLIRPICDAKSDKLNIVFLSDVA